VVFVIENIEDKNPADRRALAESFASPAVRLSIDTGHAHYAHGSTGAPPVDYYVLAAEGMLDHVHIQDADGYADRHWRPGFGTIRWPAVFDALKRIGGTPRLVLEMRDSADVLPGWQALKTMGLVR
jgi:sugar phosphate isomerase/epimerase